MECSRKILFCITSIFAYFSTHKPSTFKESMVAPIRGKAGLGHPPKQYHNNSPKCINNVIKMKIKRERSILDEFSCKMKSLVEDLQNHLVRAFTCHDEYFLHLAFSKFELDSSAEFKLAT